MSILITNAGVNTGTDGSDQFVVETALTGNGLVVNALGEGDSIVVDAGLQDDLSNISGPEFNGDGGADYVYLSGVSAFSAGNTNVNLGAGRDTLIAVDTELNSVKGGDGGDYIVIASAEGSDSLGTGGIDFLGAGAGNDTIKLFGQLNSETASAGDLELSGSKITLGAGNDLLDGGYSGTVNYDINFPISAVTAEGILSSTTVIGGGGNDTVLIEQIESSLINLDSEANGGGNDVLVITDSASASVIKGKGGADFIAISTAERDNRIAGNAGRDTIIAEVDKTNTVLGGAAADYIYIDTDSTNSGNVINGGGGLDTIILADSAESSNIIDGGAATDLVQIGTGDNYSAGEDYGTLQLTKLSDSNLAGFDTISIDLGEDLSPGSNVDIGFTVNSAGDAGFSTTAFVTPLSGGAGIGSDLFTGSITNSEGDLVAATGQVSNGYLSGKAIESANTLASAVAFTDQVTQLVDNPAGTVVTFRYDEADYLFIQGGAAGTSDDGLIKFENTNGISLESDGDKVNLNVYVDSGAGGGVWAVLP